MTEMHDTLVEFVKVLRTADVKVSPAETLDAMETLDIVGIENRSLLKNSLSMVLSKTPEEKEAFNTSFDRFFAYNKFSSENEAGEPGEDTNQDDGDFDPGSDGSDQQSGQGSGQGGGQGGGAEASEELDFDLLEAQSELGKLLLSGDRMKVMVKMAEAGRAGRGKSDCRLYPERVSIPGRSWRPWA